MENNYPIIVERPTLLKKIKSLNILVKKLLWKSDFAKFLQSTKISILP